MNASCIFSPVRKCPTNVPQWDIQLSVNRCHLLRRRNTKFAPCVNVADVKGSPPKLGFLRQLCIAPPVIWTFRGFFFLISTISTTCDLLVRGGVEEADSVRPPQLAFTVPIFFFLQRILQCALRKYTPMKIWPGQNYQIVHRSATAGRIFFGSFVTRTFGKTQRISFALKRERENSQANTFR